MSALTVNELMTQNVETVLPTDNLAHVYDLMFNRHIRHIPVVNKDRNLLGLITHRDLSRKALYATEDLTRDLERLLLKTTKVDEVMIRDVETIAEDSALAEAGQLLLDNKFGCLPVVNGNVLVGIITESDFVKYLVKKENEGIEFVDDEDQLDDEDEDMDEDENDDEEEDNVFDDEGIAAIEFERSND